MKVPLSSFQWLVTNYSLPLRLKSGSLQLGTASYGIIHSFLWNAIRMLLYEWSHIRGLSTDSKVKSMSTFCCIINSTSRKYHSVALLWKVTYRGFHTQFRDDSTDLIQWDGNSSLFLWATTCHIWQCNPSNGCSVETAGIPIRKFSC